MTAVRDALLTLLRQPEQAARMSDAQWSDIVATARNANLLGKLAATLALADAMPAGNPGRHLTGALLLSRRQRQSVTWEAHRIDAALHELDIPVVLLKGAAYSLAEHAAGQGRLFGDVDILVPRQALGDVELGLMVNGWTSVKSDAYDQRYYRQWMHEIPPMVHVRRGTVIDVHHTILPLTARYRPDPARILARSTPVDGLRCIRVPSPEDLIVHSLCHLVHEGEVHNALRDMHDIASLVLEHGHGQHFWTRLPEAAIEHDLAEPAALGLALVERFFPGAIRPACFEALGASRWRSAHQKLVARYDRAIAPSPTGEIGLSTSLAQQAIYLRSHWLRMPPMMLARHLSRKAWLRLTESPKPAPQTE
jgi:hypothetical protein